MSLNLTNNLLDRYGIQPKKRLGQNFLIDKNTVKKLVDAAEITTDDVVLEVGAGTGIITAELAARAKWIHAVEKDRNLIPVLTKKLAGLDNVQIINADILKFNHWELKLYWSLEIGHSKLVGNIPYFLTGRLLRIFLELQNKPSLIVLMVQKEVAQRICAKPPQMSILAVSVQVYAKPEIVAYVSRSSFWPQPTVDSAILKITPRPNLTNHISPNNAQTCMLTHDRELTYKFFRIVKSGFSSPRKQLINNIADAFKKDKDEIREWLLRCGIAPERRAETLSVQEWIKLTHSIS